VTSLRKRFGSSVIFPYQQEQALLRSYFACVPCGFFVEVGANDPEHNSQTWNLEQRGWTGVLVEPLPELACKLRERRLSKVYEAACSSPANAGKTLPLRLAGPHSSIEPDYFVAGTRSSGELMVQVRTLDEILVDAHAPQPVDFLSIDVEGHAVEVLAGIDLKRWRPRLILVEDHATDLRIHNALTAQGYRWVRRSGINGWYVPDESPEQIGLVGRWQFLRKHYLGTPFRRMREFKRKVRQRIRERLWGHP